MTNKMSQSDHSEYLNSVLANYRKLCDYCDQFWMKVISAYPDDFTCRKGCGICCELQSVNQLEAHCIRAFLQSQPASNDKCSGSDRCPFLSDENCTIYSARPLICRTHGLVLKSDEFTHPTVSCPYNFNNTHPFDLPDELILDIDKITENLTRLNLAFCICTGKKTESDVRVKMADLRK